MVRERSGLITAQDRCDCRRCPAAAWVRVTLYEGWLYMCGHHYVEHADALMTIVLEVVDERDLILGSGA